MFNSNSPCDNCDMSICESGVIKMKLSVFVTNSTRGKFRNCRNDLKITTSNMVMIHFRRNLICLTFSGYVSGNYVGISCKFCNIWKKHF